MRQDQYRLMYEFEDIHWWFLAKREFIKVLLPKPPKQWNILDLGCGTGGTTRFLLSWGKVGGVEICRQAEKFLKKRKVNYVRSSIEDFKFPKEAYDLVCLFDVLYHRQISSVETILQRAYVTLKKDGLLIITDSALPFLFSRHDKIMEARERFYLGKMEKLVKTAGFAVEKKSYIYFFLFPLFLVLRLISKYLPFPTVTKVNPFLNFLLLSICRFEAFLLKKLSFPIGSSLIIKARKPI